MISANVSYSLITKIPVAQTMLKLMIPPSTEAQV